MTRQLRSSATLTMAAVLGLAVAGTALCAGQVQYDSGTRTLRVTGHPRIDPATAGELYRTDTAHGWGVVDRDGKTTKVYADVVVGANDGSSTWFRIGGAQAPDETLVIRGRLTVSASKIRSWHRYTGVNGLILEGKHEDEPTVSLWFEKREQGESGIRFGQGSAFVAKRACIGASATNRAAWVGWNGSPAHLRLRDCVVSGFTRLYGLRTIGDAAVRGCIFENMGIVLGNGQHHVEDCTFRNVDCALFDGGALSALVVACRFEDNVRHWRLASTTEGIRAVDCVFGREREPGPHIRCHYWPKRGRTTYPLFLAERRIVVAVRNADGTPVPEARVTVQCEQKHCPTPLLAARTDARGRTPAVGSGRALCLADRVLQATDRADEPAEAAFTYTVTVQTQGCIPAVIRGVDPDPAWLIKSCVLSRK